MKRITFEPDSCRWAAGSVTSGTSDEDSNAETIGDILQAGNAAEAALGECYEVELIFECVH